jgi:hypothetical protein
MLSCEFNHNHLEHLKSTREGVDTGKFGAVVGIPKHLREQSFPSLYDLAFQEVHIPLIGTLKLN